MGIVADGVSCPNGDRSHKTSRTDVGSNIASKIAGEVICTYLEGEIDNLEKKNILDSPFMEFFLNNFYSKLIEELKTPNKLLEYFTKEEMDWITFNGSILRKIFSTTIVCSVIIKDASSLVFSIGDGWLYLNGKNENIPGETIKISDPSNPDEVIDWEQPPLFVNILEGEKESRRSLVPMVHYWGSTNEALKNGPMIIGTDGAAELFNFMVNNNENEVKTAVILNRLVRLITNEEELEKVIVDKAVEEAKKRLLEVKNGEKILKRINKSDEPMEYIKKLIKKKEYPGLYLFDDTTYIKINAKPKIRFIPRFISRIFSLASLRL